MGKHDSSRRKWLRLCLARKWTLLEGQRACRPRDLTANSY